MNPLGPGWGYGGYGGGFGGFGFGYGWSWWAIAFLIAFVVFFILAAWWSGPRHFR